jgi:hypothetical protein
MIVLKETIKSLYAINLVEGEGLGTAYEYFTKLRKLKRFVSSIERPERILIAGLPEKYGLSMDFILLGQALDAEIIVADERKGVLERAKKALALLKTRGILEDKKVTYCQLEHLEHFYSEVTPQGKFDLILSNEVIQRLDLNEAQEIYISNIKRLGKNFVFFVPNGGNDSHVNFSGLKSLHLDELLTLCQKTNPIQILDCGYLDMPPFPPGLSRAQEKREQAVENNFENLVMKGLELYCLLEDIWPGFIKKKIAHIAYIMAKIK